MEGTQTKSRADQFKQGARKGRMSDVNIVVVNEENPSAFFSITGDITEHTAQNGEVHDVYPIVELETKDEGFLLVGDGGGLRKLIEKEEEKTGTLLDKAFLAEWTGKRKVEELKLKDGRVMKNVEVNQYNLYIKPLSEAGELLDA